MRAMSRAATALGSTSEPPMPRAHAPALRKSAAVSQVHAAGRHQADLRQRPVQGLEVARAGQFRGEDLDDVGPRLPGGQHLGRRQGPGHDRLVVAAAEADHFEVDGRGDDELGPGEEGDAGGLGVEHRARAQEHLVAQLGRPPVRSTRWAPGTVKVTSIASTPPASRASATSSSTSPLGARSTATTPETHSARNCLVSAHRMPKLRKWQAAVNRPGTDPRSADYATGADRVSSGPAGECCVHDLRRYADAARLLRGRRSPRYSSFLGVGNFALDQFAVLLHNETTATWGNVAGICGRSETCR